MTSKRKQRYPQPVPEQTAGTVVKFRNLLKPKNFAQEMYIESLTTTPVTLCSGPAGSGKTFIVTSVALKKLMANEVDRIVITRPVVETGEKLGFLPGTLEEKLDPYLIPLMDAIEDHIGPTMTKKLIESGKIQIAPLAFMRGRTFNRSFVILDEAQNSTKEQAKMFITRMGYESFFAINGDASQTDLQRPRDHQGPWETGLEYLIRKLAGRDKNINHIQFQNGDSVRSAMCKAILTLLDTPDPRKQDENNSDVHSPIDRPRKGAALRSA